jgi:mycobactin lysine-N-oxygenase
MDTSKSGVQQTAASSIPVLAVVGAGPKAAALTTKAQVLKDLGLGEVKVVVIERDSIAANWRGSAGFTDGQGQLGTPPEKDVGFPYHSIFDSEVDMAMLRYSWQASLISLTAYSDWVDHGRENPRHENWAGYLKWALESTLTEEVIIGTVEKVVPVSGRLRIDVRHEGQTDPIEADGLVITGPGKPDFKGISFDPSELILDGKNYWRRIGVFKEMPPGKVAIIGGGETAASIALSLLNKAPQLDIEIINRHGAIFTRGESYGENKLFSNPDEWAKLDEPKRDEFIKRTDRGVFSVTAQIILGKADNVTYLSGSVSKLEEERNKIIVHLEHGKASYDSVIVAKGFDPWSPLEILPEEFRPVTERNELRQQVDYHLRVPFDSAPGLGGSRINVHMPMVSGLSQGPGFPNLSCLGHLSDRILSLYVTTIQIEQGKDGTWLWKRLTRKGKPIITIAGFQSREECEADVRRNDW